ncbi:MAG: class I SAM-dependent methyltransferase [Pseudomonadota bacterium]
MTAPSRPGWQWSEYWRGGQGGALAAAEGGGAAFDSGPLWRAFFDGFEAGARLIDLATGAGLVAGYAREASLAAGRGFSIVGVDQAELPPDAGGGEVTLMGGVALEALPFAEAAFDGAASQFGFEYADTRRALVELARVLKPGGRALMLIHHADSAVTRAAAGQAAAYDRVLGDGAAVRLARRAYAAHLNRLAPAAVRAAEAAFRAAVTRAAGRLDPAPAHAPARYLVGYLADLADRIAAYEPASALARLDAFEHGNAAWRQRQRGQLNAAMTAAQLDVFLARAARAGLACRERAQQHDAAGALVAWRVALERTAGE